MSASPRRTHPPAYGPTSRRESPAYPTVTLPPNEGRLTAALSNQKRFTNLCVAASLQAGLVPSDAVKRATDAVEWVRHQSIEHNFDSEQQEQVQMFVTACLRAGGVEMGKTLAGRGIEAMRLVWAWRKQVRVVERAKAKRGEVQ